MQTGVKRKKGEEPEEPTDRYVETYKVRFRESEDWISVPGAAIGKLMLEEDRPEVDVSFEPIGEGSSSSSGPIEPTCATPSFSMGVWSVWGSRVNIRCVITNNGSQEEQLEKFLKWWMSEGGQIWARSREGQLSDTAEEVLMCTACVDQYCRQTQEVHSKSHDKKLFKKQPIDIRTEKAFHVICEVVPKHQDGEPSFLMQTGTWVQKNEEEVTEEEEEGAEK